MIKKLGIIAAAMSLALTGTHALAKITEAEAN